MESNGAECHNIVLVLVNSNIPLITYINLTLIKFRERKIRMFARSSIRFYQKMFVFFSRPKCASGSISSHATNGSRSSADIDGKWPNHLSNCTCSIANAGRTNARSGSTTNANFSTTRTGKYHHSVQTVCIRFSTIEFLIVALKFSSRHSH